MSYNEYKRKTTRSSITSAGNSIIAKSKRSKNKIPMVPKMRTTKASKSSMGLETIVKSMHRE
jgi:hypothetical protein